MVNESLQSLVKASQREGFEVRRWTLCIPIDLSGPEHRWWLGFKRKFETTVGIECELWAARQIRTAPRLDTDISIN